MAEARFVDISEMADRSELPPFTISISGFPGTGKTTTLLKL